MFWAVDSAPCYPFIFQSYLDKEGRTPNVGQGKAIINKLCQPFYGTNHNVTGDNRFTNLFVGIESLAMVQALWGQSSIKRCTPNELTRKKMLKQYESILVFHLKATLVTYQSKKLKSVTLSSTMHKQAFVGQTPKKIIEIVDYSSSTKGVEDTFNQMIYKFNCKPKHNGGLSLFSWTSLMYLPLPLSSLFRE